MKSLTLQKFCLCLYLLLQMMQTHKTNFSKTCLTIKSFLLRDNTQNLSLVQSFLRLLTIIKVLPLECFVGT